MIIDMNSRYVCGLKAMIMILFGFLEVIYPCKSEGWGHVDGYLDACSCIVWILVMSCISLAYSCSFRGMILSETMTSLLFYKRGFTPTLHF